MELNISSISRTSSQIILNCIRDILLYEGVVINILEAPYFIATKIPALIQRGMIDLRTSKDFEDIVYLLRNRTTLIPETIVAGDKVKRFLSASFEQLLSVGYIDEAIAAVLDFGEPSGTSARIQSIMQRISAMGRL